VTFNDQSVVSGYPEPSRISINDNQSANQSSEGIFPTHDPNAKV
jgi:hypothetical protein